MTTLVVLSVVDIVLLIAGLAIYLFIVGGQLSRIATNLEECAEIVQAIGRNAAKPDLNAEGLSTCSLNEGGGASAEQPAEVPAAGENGGGENGGGEDGADVALPTVNCPQVTGLPTIPAQAAVSDQTTAAVRSLFAVVEQYPNIKSQGNVLDLQNEIERIEGQIADRRELYNDQVFQYNTRIAQVPALLLAPIFGWRPREFFSATPEETARPDTELRPA